MDMALTPSRCAARPGSRVLGPAGVRREEPGRRGSRRGLAPDPRQPGTASPPGLLRTGDGDDGSREPTTTLPDDAEIFTGGRRS
jgi:hypothetical protein